MFHLLVSYAAWPEGAGTIGSSRVYIRPNEAPGNTFLKDGKLDLAQITKIPALLVHETGSPAPQMARVAHITNVTQGPRETAIQYAVDNSIRPISNADLERFASQLGVTKNGLSHTHWAIQEADLFKILLMNQQRNAVTPKVFTSDSIGQQDITLVSVMMPFSAEFSPVYLALQSAVAATGLRSVRADNFWEHATVIQDIFNLIARARFVICDCTGRNPNVFYEAGIAHTLGKDVIIVTQSEHDVPFDLRHLRYIHYLNNNEGLQKLSLSVQSRISNLLTGVR
jgi:hypothetical protein